MADDLPDYMRGFDLQEDWGATPVSSTPTVETTPSIDPKVLDNQNLELSKVKSDVSDVKSMMNEIMQLQKKLTMQVPYKDLRILKKLYYHFYSI